MRPVLVFLDNLLSVRLEPTIVAARLGLDTEHLSLDRFLEQSIVLPTNANTVLLSCTLCNLKQVFRAVHLLKRVNVPRVVVHPLTALYGSVILDLEDLGSIVLPPIPTIEQILQTFATADEADARISKRGVVIRLSGSADPWIMGPRRGEREYRLGSGKQRPIFLSLAASVGLVVTAEELALDADCDSKLVKVYIQRLRTRYEVVRKHLDLRVSKLSFIEEGEGGYRLNARIKRPI